MTKKIMTMLVACALSVSAFSTTAVFAEDAVVTGDTSAVIETTPAAYEPEISAGNAWTGDNDIVFDVDTKGGTVNTGEMYIYNAADGANPVMGVQAKVEVNEEGKGKITFTKDALKNAKTWDDNFENQISVDWTKINKIEFNFGFKLGDQYKSKTVYVEASVKAPETTVTPTTPSKPSTPAKPAENKGTTTTASTKKEAPKTGDTMNVALYASLLVVSALAAVVLTTKKRMAE
ncbi:LPXTG cell wall anchor domain-containing protein [Catenibacterium mitsuokai]|uniref:LPXTG cell wall anchor domain-containing protein n=1 Tax=Catenibacterium mitsuokai TaxID=100886 RepID=UPI0022DF1162|nr:LPXTG cell wall anchor domain-containing protein [Catenibacterium mitsuokai]